MSELFLKSNIVLKKSLLTVKSNFCLRPKIKLKGTSPIYVNLVLQSNLELHVPLALLPR